MTILAAFMVPHPPLIIPDVGKGGEEQIRATIDAYENIASQIAELRPETIIITSPHAVMYADYFHISDGKGATGSFSRFGASQVSFKETYDTELRDEICALADEMQFPAGVLGERDKNLDHGVMVPLYFIRKKYNDFRILRSGLSGLALSDHYRYGMMIRKAVEKTGRKCVIIASGDLSHKLQEYGPYGYAAEGPQYDRRIMDVMGKAAFGELFEFGESFCDKAAECGHRSFVIMAGAFDGMAVEAKAYSHEDVTGVGYGICSFYPLGKDENRHFLDDYMKKQEEELKRKTEEADPYVKLARKSLESFILRREIIAVPDDIPEEMRTKKAGTFVSLHKEGKLRGCIGTISPVRSCVAEEIIYNAVSAAARDPRFSPVRADELKWLEISVDELSEPEAIDTADQLDVKRYGVIVSKGARRGLLLPDLEGVDTVEDQINIAMNKAGIHSYEDVRLERFEVIRHT